MSVCAVIATYNRRADVERCLESLLAQTRPVDEIIVVDNASSDGTDALVTQKFAGCVRYLRLPENRGGSGAFHEGMKEAYARGHEWIWCLDSDANPYPDTLEKLWNAGIEGAEPIVAKTCPAVDPNTGQLFPGGDALDYKLCREVTFAPSGWNDRVLEIETAYLCSLLVKAEAARMAGFGDPALFVWYDDLIFSHALRKFGRILHVGTTAVRHPTATPRLRPVVRRGRARAIAEDYWKLYYLFRNVYFLRCQCFGTWRAFWRHFAGYARMMAAIAALDDRKLYRMTILTRAFLDAVLGRKGRRVLPPGGTRGSHVAAR